MCPKLWQMLDGREEIAAICADVTHLVVPKKLPSRDI